MPSFIEPTGTCGMGRGGGQRFSKHTLIAISPLQGKNIKRENFALKFTPKQAFLEDIFGGV